VGCVFSVGGGGGGEGGVANGDKFSTFLFLIAGTPWTTRTARRLHCWLPPDSDIPKC